MQGTDQKDVGMAASGIRASSSQQFGTAEVVFPKQGYVGQTHLTKTLFNWSSRTYQVIAVNG